MYLGVKKDKEFVFEVIFLIEQFFRPEIMGERGQGQGQGHVKKPMSYSFLARRDESIDI